MSVPLKFDRPSAIDYFASLVAEDSSIALLEAAISIALDDQPRLDVQSTLAAIDALAVKLKRRIASDAAPLQRLRLLNHYFFRELGFAGNVNNYYDRRNSYLHEVIATRRGIPITLALLYMELAGQIGLHARGVAFPGHFLVKLRMPRGEVVLDPFTGESLSREVLDERLAPYRRRHGLVGDFETPLGLFLQAAPPRDILARMLRNLKEIHTSESDWVRALAVSHRLVILLPRVWEEHRDRALVWAELGQYAAAIDDLEHYLEHRSDAADAPGLRQRLLELKRRVSPRLR
jgi:regulator of sirC expression with transglutaminase-like and TPR domain